MRANSLYILFFLGIAYSSWSVVPSGGESSTSDEGNVEPYRRPQTLSERNPPPANYSNGQPTSTAQNSNDTSSTNSQTSRRSELLDSRQFHDADYNGGPQSPPSSSVQPSSSNGTSSGGSSGGSGSGSNSRRSDGLVERERDTQSETIVVAREEPAPDFSSSNGTASSNSPGNSQDSGSPSPASSAEPSSN
ncbi:hypothetical protein SISSUDRAFT_1041378 [Sistotremastrum suecicum HHB10207 ss-3]|uniref:Uncharacterized protein n=1 Tax=Sistotremastrum suecicum HHB10207 ss-3 TaxID=1314776 RepID=A0A166H797_9AGAM|nr:hypothetical protein SISSUDRAFT_1041378 [Sistotremastrum suecicum HHB10207 ss-3]